MQAKFLSMRGNPFSRQWKEKGITMFRKLGMINPAICISPWQGILVKMNNCSQCDSGMRQVGKNFCIIKKDIANLLTSREFNPQTILKAQYIHFYIILLWFVYLHYPNCFKECSVRAILTSDITHPLFSSLVLWKTGRHQRWLNMSCIIIA